MITAKFVKKTTTSGGPGDRPAQDIVYAFTIPSVGAGAASDTIRFLLSPQFFFGALKILCDSTDFDLSFRDRNGVTVPTLHEVLSIVNINKYFYDTTVDIAIINNDDPISPYLYLVIKNNAGIATGLITARFRISQT